MFCPIIIITGCFHILYGLYFDSPSAPRPVKYARLTSAPAYPNVTKPFVAPNFSTGDSRSQTQRRKVLLPPQPLNFLQEQTLRFGEEQLGVFLRFCL